MNDYPMKFMAWDKEKNEWYKPTYEAYKGNLEYLTLSLNGRLSMVTMHNKDDESLFPDRFTLYPFTTAHDSKGKEIYAGHKVIPEDGGDYFLLDNEEAYEVFWTDYASWSLRDKEGVEIDLDCSPFGGWLSMTINGHVATDGEGEDDD